MFPGSILQRANEGPRISAAAYVLCYIDVALNISAETVCYIAASRAREVLWKNRCEFNHDGVSPMRRKYIEASCFFDK